MKPYFNQIVFGDCLEVMPKITEKIDLIITDPPYPDYYAEEYHYKEGILDFLKDIPCRQFIFWSAKVDFPLDYTAIHIWDKKTGVGSMYERIFERNGQKNYKVFNSYLINSSVAANFTNDIWTEHPSQKPLKLISRLVNDYSKENDLIVDPFAGSGTTGVACKNLGRNFILIEKDPEYCKIAEKRLSQNLLF